MRPLREDYRLEWARISTYVMFRDLRVELILKQLVMHPEIKKLKHKNKTLLAFSNTKDNTFWQSAYGVCGISYLNVRFFVSATSRLQLWVNWSMGRGGRLRQWKFGAVAFDCGHLPK